MTDSTIARTGTVHKADCISAPGSISVPPSFHPFLSFLPSLSPIPLAVLSLVYYPSLPTHTRVWSSRVVSVRPRWRCLGGFIGRSRRKRTKSPFLDNALSLPPSYRARRCAVKVIARKGSLKTAVAGWLVDWRCWEILTFIRPAAATALPMATKSLFPYVSRDSADFLHNARDC